MENELETQENQEKSPRRRDRTRSKEGFGSKVETVVEEAPKPETKPELAPEPPEPAPEPPKPAPKPQKAPEPEAPKPVRKSKVIRPTRPQGSSNRGIRQR